MYITHKSGREDYVFSSKDGKKASYKDKSSDASYALVGNEKDGDFVLFMGNGTWLEANGYTIYSTEKGNVVLEEKDGKLSLHNEVFVTISSGKKEMEFGTGHKRIIKFK